MSDAARAKLAEGLNARVFYGWIMVVVAGFCIFGSGPGQSHTFAAFNALIAADLGLSLTGVSYAYGAATVVAAFLLPYFGGVVERNGPRRSLLLVSGLLGVACCFFGAVAVLDPGLPEDVVILGTSLNALAMIVWLGLGFALLRYFGQGAMMLGSANLVAQWFSAKRGFAMGLMALGFACSMAIHPTLSRFLIEMVGWRWAWVGLGLITWALMIPVIFWLVQDRPEKMGLRPDGEAALPDGQAAPALTGSTLEQALRHRSFWIVALGLFLMAGLVTTLHFHQYNIMESQGMSAGAATLSFWISAITMVVMMPVVGRGFDRFRTRYMFAAALVVQASTLVGVTFVTSTPALVVYAMAFGLNNAFTMTMFGYIWPRYFGRLHLGRIQGRGQMIGVVGASVGPLPVAYAFDIIGDPVVTLQLLALLPLAAIALVIGFLKTAPQVTGSEHLE